VLQKARERGLQLDTVAQNSVITAMGRGLHWPLALFSLEQALKANLARVRSYRAAIAAVTSAGWPMVLWLLSSMYEAGTPKPDLECFNEAMFACVQSAPWEICIGLLEVMKRHRCGPDLRAYACAARACGLGQAWQQALQLQECTADPAGSLWNAVAWALQAAGRGLPPTPRSITVNMRKEHDVVNFVRRRAKAGDLNSVLAAIETFANGRKWLKVAGGRKASLLQGTLLPGDCIVEFGTYMGYSAMLMASRLRELGGGGCIQSCDVNALTWPFANELISWAMVTGEVQLRVGCAADWLASARLGRIDVLLLDHRSTVYQDDLRAAESHLAPGARVLADNVLLPGAPLFLAHVADGYDVTIHEVPEFMQPELEDWILSCTPKTTSTSDGSPKDLRELRQWCTRVDDICWESRQIEVDWKSFQAELSPVLRAWSVKHGLQAAYRKKELQPGELRVFELRRELRQMGRDDTGPKSALVARYLKALAEHPS